MTEKYLAGYYVDTAIGTLPMWAVWIDSTGEHWADPIDGWLRVVGFDERVKIVPAEYVEQCGLRPMNPPPSSVHHTRAEAEKAVRSGLAALWRRELHELLGWVDGLPAEERVPTPLRQRLADWDRQAAAATDQRTAYEALVADGYLTEGRVESTMQVPRPAGGVEVVTVPAEPAELTAKGRELAGLDTE
ncbi:hypothetical protein [Rhodococcus pyridinivorans]|uniref:Uncharacterized protein n=1 Tax=Rhodococcus pyridinivorans AK37 TaxID=1114960 RepID=H0JNC6_9NOCA|nr:hypothetical protein [Rhodococcus pyridinivorans]EHK84898.1 hypothetical protein AK37_05547 [Rhodococcus pyridinivorans AK37]MCD2142281.1 hypothetical protein [Rhodococcus pyridinivorans]